MRRPWPLTAPQGVVRWSLDCILKASEVDEMVWLAATIILLLWLLGVATSAVEGVVVHLLLVAALGVMLAGIVQGRKAI